MVKVIAPCAPISDNTCDPVLYFTTPASLTKNLSVSVSAFGIFAILNLNAVSNLAASVLLTLIVKSLFIVEPM